MKRPREDNSKSCNSVPAILFPQTPHKLFILSKSTRQGTYGDVRVAPQLSVLAKKMLAAKRVTSASIFFQRFILVLPYGLVKDDIIASSDDGRNIVVFGRAVMIGLVWCSASSKSACQSSPPVQRFPCIIFVYFLRLFLNFEIGSNQLFHFQSTENDEKQ